MFDQVIATGFMQDFVAEQYDGKDKAATMLRERCLKLAENPPGEDWDIAAELRYKPSLCVSNMHMEEKRVANS